MHDRKRREYCWPHMANYVYKTVNYCLECNQNKLSDKHQRPFQIFPASGSPEFFAMDILKPHPKTLSSHPYVLILTDCYSKLAWAVPRSKITASLTSSPFMHSHITPYGIPTNMFTDSGSQLVRKLFESLRASLGRKHLTTATFHSQMRKQAGRYCKTIITKLQHHVEEHERHWPIYVQRLTYAFSPQVHRTINLTPFSLVLPRQPPEPTTFESPKAISTGATATISLQGL